MRIFIFMLLTSLPFAAQASVANSVQEANTIVFQPVTHHSLTLKKERFFDRIAKNILEKRVRKALGRSNSESAKPLAVSGFICSVLGAILLFLTVAAGAGLLLLLAGLALSIIALVVSDSSGKKWVKALAIVGITIPSLVVLFFLILYAALLIVLTS